MNLDRLERLAQAGDRDAARALLRQGRRRRSVRLLDASGAPISPLTWLMIPTLRGLGRPWWEYGERLVGALCAPLGDACLDVGGVRVALGGVVRVSDALATYALTLAPGQPPAPWDVTPRGLQSVLEDLGWRTDPPGKHWLNGEEYWLNRLAAARPAHVAARALTAWRLQSLGYNPMAQLGPAVTEKARLDRALLDLLIDGALAQLFEVAS